MGKSSESSRLVLDSMQETVWWPHAPSFVSSPAHWARAIDYSVSLHAELPFAVHVQRAGWAEALPTIVADQLADLERRERMRLALLDFELEAALDALLGARIPVAVIKGADLARRFYPERILRPMGDVDLLVPKEAYQESWNVLERAGFAATEKRYDHCFRSALARSPECPSIDLHFGLVAGDTPQRLTEIWKRSVTGQLEGLAPEVRALSHEDCLIYVLRHAAVLHVLEDPVWLADLHWIIVKSPALDWSFVLHELRETRSRAAAWFVFRLLSEQWGSPIPAKVLRELGHGVGGLRKMAAVRRHTMESWFPSKGRGALWMLSSRYLLRESAADAFRYAYDRWRRKRHEREIDQRNLPQISADQLE